MTTRRVSARSALFLFVCLFSMTAPPAHAQVRWKAGFSASDLKEWVTVQCGGQGTSCPCSNTSYGPGTCDTATETGTPISSTSGRFQVRTDGSDKVLRVELREGDSWGSNNSNRNEVVYAQETAGTPTKWGEGSDRYFSWSVKFDTSFPAPTCGGGSCAQGWNVFTQWHQEGNDHSPPLAFVLRPNGTDYDMAFNVKDRYDDCWQRETDVWTKPLKRGVWHRFILHVKFSTSTTTGLVELWYAEGTATPVKQTLDCPSIPTSGCPSTRPGTTPTQTCHRNTLYTNTDGTAMRNHLKLGLYRDPSLDGTAVASYKNVVSAMTYSDALGTDESDPGTTYWHAGNFRYLPARRGDLASFVSTLEHPNAAGYGKVSSTREANFHAFLDALFTAIADSRADGNTGDWCGVKAAADNAGYTVERFRDTATGRWFVYGYDRTSFGQAYFFINPNAKRNLVIEVPHEPTEAGTGVEGVRLFTALAARALIINKEHRCSDLDASTCSGTTTVCGGAYRESDVAHHERNTFHMLHTYLSGPDSNSRFVQLHGMSGDTSNMIEIGDGTNNDVDTGSVSVTFANALQGYMPNPSAVYACQGAVGNPPSNLCGSSNVQGRYTNEPASDVCTDYTQVRGNRFLHLEQEYRLHNDDASDGYDWTYVSNALKDTWPQCDMNSPSGTTTCDIGPSQINYDDLNCSP